MNSGARKFLGVQDGLLQAHVEPHSNLLLAVHELKDHPQFLSTDRHITQGGVELADLDWNQDREELSSRLRLVENDPLTLSVYVPATYRFSKATATGATVERVIDEAPVTSVVVRSSTSGEARVVLDFVRQSGSAALRRTAQ